MISLREAIEKDSKELSQVTPELIVNDFYETLCKMKFAGTTINPQEFMELLTKQYKVLFKKRTDLNGLFRSQQMYQIIFGAKVAALDDAGFRPISSDSQAFTIYIVPNLSESSLETTVAIKKVMNTMYGEGFIPSDSIEFIANAIYGKDQAFFDENFAHLISIPINDLYFCIRKYLVTNNYVPVFGGFAPKDTVDDVEIMMVYNMYATLCSSFSDVEAFRVYNYVLLSCYWMGDTLNDFHNREVLSIGDCSWMPGAGAVTKYLKRLKDACLKTYCGICTQVQTREIQQKQLSMFTLDDSRLALLSVEDTNNFRAITGSVQNAMVELDKEFYADKTVSNQFDGKEYYFFTDFLPFDIAAIETAAVDNKDECIKKVIDILLETVGVIPSIHIVKELADKISYLPLPTYEVIDAVRNGYEADYNGFYPKGKAILNAAEIYADMQYHY